MRGISEDESRPVSPSVDRIHDEEIAKGYARLDAYADFAERVAETKRQLLSFLIEAKRAGKSVVGYGAPGKGNTLLNYCGIRTDFLDYTVNRNEMKQNTFLPGSRIPVHAPRKFPRHGRITCSCCRGISRRKSSISWATFVSGGGSL